MSIFNKILFPVDLSEASAKIVPYVRDMVEKYKAELHVIFVAHVSSYYASIDLPYTYMTDFETEIIKGAEKKLFDFIDTVFKDTPCKARVISGYPAEEILQYAMEEGIDLIIMGTHGRKILERIVFGSVASHVVQKSPIPVLTINPYKKTEGKDAQPVEA